MRMYRKISVLFLLVVFMALSALPAMAQDSSAAQGLLPNAKLDITHLRHVYQNWNNCSGATLSMGLSYFGYPLDDFGDQEPARMYLKPDPEDGNVSPWQMADYVNNVVGTQYNVKALVRRGGDLDTLKHLLMNDFPVIIEKGYEVADVEGWMGHYLLMIGYDEPTQVFYTYDSYLGHNNLQGREETYAYISENWRHFNNAFIVLYPPAEEAAVQEILGPLWEEDSAWQTAREQSATIAATNPNDAWAWFNIGEADTALGNYETAAVAFTQAFSLQQLPWRLLWYEHGPFEAFYQTGQFNTVIDMAMQLQNVTPYIEEANYYRGLVYAAQGNVDQALFRLNLVLEFNPNFYPAQEAIDQINSGTIVAPIQTDAVQ
jgi:hypothetical protein